MRRLGLAIAIIIIGAEAAAGCSSASNVVSCTISSPDDAGAPSTVCQEFSGLSGPDQDAWGGNCVVSHGSSAAPIDASATYVHAPCSRTDAIGGCRAGGSVSLTVWYYADGPTAAADIPAICAQSGGTFVAP